VIVTSWKVYKEYQSNQPAVQKEGIKLEGVVEANAFTEQQKESKEKGRRSRC
jgi:hypothetical protein